MCRLRLGKALMACQMRCRDLLGECLQEQGK